LGFGGIGGDEGVAKDLKSDGFGCGADLGGDRARGGGVSSGGDVSEAGGDLALKTSNPWRWGWRRMKGKISFASGERGGNVEKRTLRSDIGILEAEEIFPLRVRRLSEESELEGMARLHERSFDGEVLARWQASIEGSVVADSGEEDRLLAERGSCWTEQKEHSFEYLNRRWKVGRDRKKLTGDSEGCSWVLGEVKNRGLEAKSSTMQSERPRKLFEGGRKEASA
jgi:hypothetical protein